MQLFADREQLERSEAACASEGPAGAAPLVDLAWALRQADTRRALALADRAQAALALGQVVVAAEPASGPDTFDPAVETAHATALRARLALIRGEALWLDGDLEPALGLARAALQVLAGPGQDPVGGADAHRLVALIELDSGRINEFDARMALAEEFARRAGDPVRVRVARTARRLQRALTGRDGDDADDAGDSDRPGERASVAAPPRDDAATAVESSLAALRAFQRNDHAVCIEALTRGLDAALRHGQTREAVTIATNVAATLTNLNDPQGALEWAQRALDLARPTGWPSAVGLALVQTANILRELGRLAIAETLLREALGLLERLPHVRNATIALLYLGDVLVAQDQPAAALDSYARCEERARRYERKDALVAALIGRARGLWRLGRAGEAEGTAEAALALACELGEATRQIEALQVLADVHAGGGVPPPAGLAAPSAALHFLFRARAIAAGIAGYTVSADLLAAIARAQAAVGDWEGAYRHAVATDAARSEAGQREAGRRAIAMEVRHQTERARTEAAHQRELAIVEAHRAEAAARAAATLERLGQIGQEITAARRIEDVYASLERHVHALLDAAHFGVWLLEPDGARMVLAFGVDHGVPLPRHEVRLDDPRAHSACCVRERREVLHHRPPGPPGPNRIPGTVPSLTVLFAPLVVGDRVLGTMTIQSPRAAAYGERERMIFRSLCAYGAIAVERLQIEAALQGLNERLESIVAARTAALSEANRELETIAYTLAHDLRAPARHVAGLASRLAAEHGGALGEQGLRWLGLMRGSAERQALLVDEMLSYMKLGMKDVVRQEVDMDAVVRDAIEANPPARTDGVAIEWRVAPLPPAVGDAAMIRAVLCNLVGNAVKFTGPTARPAIAIDAAVEDGMSVYAVRDNGIGFDPARATKLFGLFERLHASPAFPGNGVGLAVVQRLVGKHGGRVWFEAREGEGATFYVTFEAGRDDG